MPTGDYPQLLPPAPGDEPPKRRRAKRPPPLIPWVWHRVDCGAAGLVNQHATAEPTSNVRLKIAQEHAKLNPRFPVIDVWLRMDRPGKILFRENALVISFASQEPQFEVIHVVNAEEPAATYGRQSPFAGRQYKGRRL